jgi:hypothetical protein
MVHPWVMEQLVKEHQQEILEASRARGGQSPRVLRIRQRLGWSLVGLGARLALDERRGPALRPVTRP